MSKVSEFISKLAVASSMAVALVNIFEGNTLVALGFANLAVLLSIFNTIEDRKENK